MIYLASAFGILMALSAFVVWCSIRIGAKSDQEFDEAQISAACEGAMIAELSDLHFVRDGK